MADERFISIDVETANEWFGSICQVGAVIFENGSIVEEFETLVNPKAEFNEFNVRLHKITEESVSFAPLFPEVLDRLKFMVGDPSRIGSQRRWHLASPEAGCCIRPLAQRGLCCLVRPAYRRVASW